MPIREFGEDQRRREPARGKLLPAIRKLHALLHPCDLHPVLIGEQELDLSVLVLVAKLTYRVAKGKVSADLGAWAFTLMTYEWRSCYVDVSSVYTYLLICDQLSLGRYDRIEFFTGDRQKIDALWHENVLAEREVITGIIQPIKASVAHDEFGSAIDLASPNGTLNGVHEQEVPSIRDLATKGVPVIERDLELLEA